MWVKEQVRVRQVREAKFVTQAELAEMTGISRANLSLIERGKQRPQTETLRKIAEALGVKSAELIDGRSP